MIFGGGDTWAESLEKSTRDTIKEADVVLLHLITERSSSGGGGGRKEDQEQGIEKVWNGVAVDQEAQRAVSHHRVPKFKPWLL